MERTLTTEERIRRAEEIYAARKRAQGSGVARESIHKARETKPELGLFRKMILQIIICLLIYLIFYLIQNTNYIFSEPVLEKTKEILSYDINFGKLANDMQEYLKAHSIVLPFRNTQEQQEENEKENKEDKQDEQNTIETQETQKTDENIGGAVEVENTENLTQEEKDVKDIKDNYSLIKPLEGNVTSRFGPRNPTTPTVPKQHTGIDIAANVGTVIRAAMDGRVTLNSNQGDYGLHLKIENNDVMTIYAHCSKLYVQEGEQVKQGQEIAEVGATGNVTGPHLHFEIRKDGRLVDPTNILEF